MPLLQILEILVVVGVLLWLVNRFIPMQGSIKSIFRNPLISHHKVADLFEPLQEGSADLLVSLGEFSRYLIQKRPDLIFRKRHDPGDNPTRSLGILVSEGTEKNGSTI